jgi:DNA-binding winged helix-turn-helix (wHTH) protein
LRFDGFELDMRAGELRRHGVRLRLRGQPLHVLEILLERAGDVVTREELQSRIWVADTFVDFDHSLHNAIARIREVLGDSADNPRYIETLPRRGYRYIGPLEDMEAPGLAVETGEHATQGPGTGTTPERRKSPLLFVVPFFWSRFSRSDSLAGRRGATSTRKRPVRRYIPLPFCRSVIYPAIRRKNTLRTA